MLILHSALHAEARALIQHFRLKRRHDLTTFACFANDDIFLIESGVGKVDTATAIGWTGAFLQTEQPVWLNIGMAGHATRQLGDILLAHRIEDQSSGQRFYPPQILHPLPGSENLITVDRPIDEYPEHAMIDMEASAFVRSASRFSPLELVHSIKVISDNRAHPPRRIKAAAVESLIAPHTDEIEKISAQLLKLRLLVIDQTIDIQKQIVDQWHFSQYQRGQLKRLLQRYHALHAEQLLLDNIPRDIQSGKQFINWLGNTLATTPVSY
jgi:nucleoside phosphorylase